MSFKRSDINLGNWRTPPYARWAFQNVQEIVPSAIIKGASRTESATVPLGKLAALTVLDEAGSPSKLDDFLEASKADSLVIMQDGEFVAEWHAPTCDRMKPHLCFSVSKSVTGILAGILADKGILSPDDPIAKYIPESKGSAYGDATIRQVLDMEVALDFNEDYLDNTGGFDRYRRSTSWNPEDLKHPSTDLKTFLCTIPKRNEEHGLIHRYYSPNTDMIGAVLEAASGRRVSDLLSESIWIPMGAHSDAFITVDRVGSPRTAGGMSITPRDLARFGDIVRKKGMGLVSENWIADLWNGSRETWDRGDQVTLFLGGSYRSFWYETGRGEIAAIGIHGQWIWVDPANATTIILQSAQDVPVSRSLEFAAMGMFRDIIKALG
mgnify:CR=1 FL=1